MRRLVVELVGVGGLFWLKYVLHPVCITSVVDHSNAIPYRMLYVFGFRIARWVTS